MPTRPVLIQASTSSTFTSDAVSVNDSSGGRFQLEVGTGATATFVVEAKSHSDAGWVDVGGNVTLSGLTAGSYSVGLDTGWWAVRVRCTSVSGGTVAAYLGLEVAR